MSPQSLQRGKATFKADRETDHANAWQSICRAWSTGNGSGLNDDDITSYVAHDSLGWEYVNGSINLAPYLEDKIKTIYLLDGFKYYRESVDSVVKNEPINGSDVR